VDWWVAVKEPSGTGYYYGDSNGGDSFQRSPNSMNDTTVGALASTLRQIWNSPISAYILWNDEPPANTGYNFSYGHTKAALAIDTGVATGFWLTHSIPLFPAGPALTSTYAGLGSNAWTYAQSAACFSLGATDIDALAKTLQLNRPQIYDTGGPLESTSVAFQALATGEWRGDAICERTAIGPLTLFAKTSAWNADLWSACVAPALESDLWVESWLRGSEEGPACSGQWKTLDVESLAWDWSETSSNLRGYKPIHLSPNWSEQSDHSKWAVAPNATLPTLCIGDINRMTTQYARAGGAVCWQTPLAITFITAITSKNKCVRI
jgi:deoxyribonuclease-2